MIPTLRAPALQDRITVTVQVEVRSMAKAAQVTIYPVANMSGNHYISLAKSIGFRLCIYKVQLILYLVYCLSTTLDFNECGNHDIDRLVKTKIG